MTVNIIGTHPPTDALHHIWGFEQPAVMPNPGNRSIRPMRAFIPTHFVSTGQVF